MLLALGAASSVIDALQSLTSQKSPSAGQPPANPFDVSGSATASAGAASSQPVSGFSPISPQTMSALIAAQGDTTNTAPTNPSDALQDLFSQIDANKDGSITRTEFENALGAGGTNIAAADDVFGKLDGNGDGSVSLGEMKSALQSAGGHHGHGHHMHAHGAGSAGGSGGGDGSGSDPLLQALSGASSTSVTNSDGSTTTSITYADGSKVSLTMPAASTPSSSSATSSYNLIEQLIQRETQALSTSAAASLSVSV
jgi:hypothetical protein